MFLRLSKFSVFFIYTIATSLFFYYLNAAYYINSGIDWLLNDVKDNEIYDYIIVGAGSAGVTVASKLLDAGYKIALIEAGGIAPWFADIPVLAPLFQQSSYDWQYKTVPQTHACRGLINNQSMWPMGKVLGGSSRLNYMAYVKGHPADYQEWFPDYNKYDEKSRNYVNKTGWCSELCEAVLKGIDELSPINVTSAERYHNEIFHFEKVKLTMVNGERWSTDKLLRNNKNAYNRNFLNVIIHAHVNKINFKLNKAEGVELTKWNKRYKLRAKNGVVISAGAIGSPKLLMLSGIGSRDDLEMLNIDVIRNLPVGKNLMDHILTGIDLITLNQSLSVSLIELLKPKSILNYFLFHQGPWTSAGIEVVGTIDKTNKKLSVSPDIQLMVIPLGVSQDNGVVLRKAMGIKDEVYQNYFHPLYRKTAITIAPVLLHPKSSGQVKLKSSDPRDEPHIDPQYLSHEDDVKILIKGIKFIEKLINTEAMMALGAVLYNKQLPGCEHLTFGSTNYWDCYIRHLTLTSYHPAGTCKMGSVVDNSFRVLSTEKLYVVDASILPILPSGNINAAVMGLAEKAAKIIIKSSLSTKRQLKNLQKYCKYKDNVNNNINSYNNNKNNLVSYIFLSRVDREQICRIESNY